MAIRTRASVFQRLAGRGKTTAGAAAKSLQEPIERLVTRGGRKLTFAPPAIQGVSAILGGQRKQQVAQKVGARETSVEELGAEMSEAIRVSITPEIAGASITPEVVQPRKEQSPLYIGRSVQGATEMRPGQAGGIARGAAGIWLTPGQEAAKEGLKRTMSYAELAKMAGVPPQKVTPMKKGNLTVKKIGNFLMGLLRRR